MVNAIRLPDSAPRPDVTRHSIAPEIRMISAADDTRLEQFGAHLSERSRYQRFFSSRSFLPGEVRRLTDLDPNCEVAMVATTRQTGDECIVGVARYVIGRLEHSAEVAIVVTDEWQQEGLGRALLSHLLAHATARGICSIKGSVLASNLAMQRLALRLGFSLHRVAGDGTVLEIKKQLAAEH